MIAIAAAGIVYTYPRGNFTLSCPRLALPAGKISLITGHNGSGKTTLSKLMCGLLRPKRGELKIFGTPAGHLSLGEIGARVGYLFQNPRRQLFAATVWREMTFAGSILGLDSAAVEKKAEQLLRRFGLLPLAGRSIYCLSQGEKQRLALCTILMNGAQFLILDEPTAGLDSENRAELYAFLDELPTLGKGAAVITHDEELIARYPARQVLVENGKVTAEKMLA